MARLNIETSLWADGRFQNLMISLGDRFRATGMVVHLWTLAQEYWYPDKLLIPNSVWATSGLSEELILCGLAERREDGVYAKGAEEHFEWRFKRVAAARKGAEVTNAKRKEGRKKDGALTVAAAEHDRGVAGHEHADAQQTSASSSSSSSSSKDLNTIVQRKRRTTYTDEFNKIYNQYPRKEGKAGGFKIFLQLRHDQHGPLTTAISNYKDLCRREKREPKFIKQFSAFMEDWEDYVDPLHTDIGTTRALLSFGSED